MSANLNLQANGDTSPPRSRHRMSSTSCGIAIVLMALDHVREFLQAEQVDPTDLSQTNAPLFLTRPGSLISAPRFLSCWRVSVFHLALGP